MPSRGVVFAWGDTLYNPNRAGVSPDLMTHEEVHGAQQKAMGGPEIWWERYLIDPKFRLEQEIEAYGAQARYLRWMSGRKKYLEVFEKISRDLSSSLYGNIISYEEAADAIEKASMQDVMKKYA